MWWHGSQPTAHSRVTGQKEDRIYHEWQQSAIRLPLQEGCARRGHARPTDVASECTSQARRGPERTRRVVNRRSSFRLCLIDVLETLATKLGLVGPVEALCCRRNKIGCVSESDGQAVGWRYKEGAVLGAKNRR